MSMHVREGQKINWGNIDIRDMDTYPEEIPKILGNVAVPKIVHCSNMPNLSNPNRDDLSAEQRWSNRNE